MCVALKQQVSESTNRFCEARVAVLGFKCKVIQLTGELEKARAVSYSGVCMYVCMYVCQFRMLVCCYLLS